MNKFLNQCQTFNWFNRLTHVSSEARRVEERKGRVGGKEGKREGGKEGKRERGWVERREGQRKGQRGQVMTRLKSMNVPMTTFWSSAHIRLKSWVTLSLVNVHWFDVKYSRHATDRQSFVWRLNSLQQHVTHNHDNDDDDISTNINKHLHRFNYFINSDREMESERRRDTKREREIRREGDTETG